jgi:hypothetical protein
MFGIVEVQDPKSSATENKPVAKHEPLGAPCILNQIAHLCLSGMYLNSNIAFSELFVWRSSSKVMERLRDLHSATMHCRSQRVRFQQPKFPRCLSVGKRARTNSAQARFRLVRPRRYWASRCSSSSLGRGFTERISSRYSRPKQKVELLS